MSVSTATCGGVDGSPPDDRSRTFVSTEIGGHAWFIIRPDADPVHAARGLALVRYVNSGQQCILPDRVFVLADLLDPLIGKRSKRVSTMEAGSGFEAGASIGPLVNDAALEKVHRQVLDMLAKGAELIAVG